MLKKKQGQIAPAFRRFVSFVVAAFLLLQHFLIISPVAVKAALTPSVSLTLLGTAYNQDFDTLASSSTSSSTPDGWGFSETGSNANTTYTAGTGSSNAGDTYSFGAASSSERAFGGLRSGSLIPIIGASFTNNTGSTINSLLVEYTGEQWRLGTAGRGADRIDFQYSTSATNLTTGTWTDVDALDFSSPITSGTVGALNGNHSDNRVKVSSTIMGLNIPNGATFFIRWTDFDAPNADDGLAIDDFSVTPNGSTTSTPNLKIDDVTVDEGDSGTVTASFTVSLSSPAPAGGVTFDIATQDNTATIADNDYVSRSLTAQTISSGSQSYVFDVTINGDTNIEPNETFFVNVTNITGATAGDTQGIGTITNDDFAPPVFDVVISQVYGGGGNSGAPLQNDFIELFNRGTTTQNLSGWSVQYASAGGSTWQKIDLSGTIAPGGYYLVKAAAGTSCSGAACGSPLPAADATGTFNMSGSAGRVVLSSGNTLFTANSCPIGGSVVDLVGYGAATCFEGGGPTSATSNTTAAFRKRGGCFDSNNNNSDFTTNSPNPRNSSSPARSCSYTPLAIHSIQGSGLSSPYAGQDVSTSGIVTAKKSNGFFLQTPDASADSDPNTSEAIFVFTSSTPAVAAGDFVNVQGTASEFFNLTQVESTLPGDVSVVSSGNSLPAPVMLTTTILDPNGTVNQLERFEGMRMHAGKLVSVAPTNEYGETFTVLEGVTRPMREPGIEISQPVPPDPTTGVPDCCIPRWDQNPERIMIDSDGLAGSSVISVTSNVAFTNVTGPLDFTFGNYKVLPEETPAVSENMRAIPVPAPEAGEFTIAAYNIENFRSSNTTQLSKAALAIRNVMRMPDIIGHIEIADLASLQALANQVNNEAVTNGDPNPAYEARLITTFNANSTPSTQNVGFLVKTSRVRVDSVVQEELPGCVGTAATCYTFTNPSTNQPERLNDRPPLVLTATIDPSGVDPRQVIVVVNHLRSFIDIGLMSGEGSRVRAKRKAQAEFLAELLQKLQTDNPTTPVISVGDYNAFQFSDGYTDPIATIKGTPTADDEIVVDDSPDVVNPDFVNLTDSLPANQQYTFIFNGTPQALDHILVNTVANSMVQRYAIARNNADFPEVPGTLYSGVATRPEANSDHDMPVAYFKFPQRETTTTVSNVEVTYNLAGQNVALKADVSADINTVNEGTVVFTVTTPDGLTTIGTTDPAGVTNGTATATFFLPASVQPQALKITANFSGGDTTLPSAGTGTLTIKYAVCLLYDPTKAVKSGAAYPIKIRLCDSSGTNVSSAQTPVIAQRITKVSDLDNSVELNSAGNANPNNGFRFDAGFTGYIFNLKTTGLSGVYLLHFTAGNDPTVHNVEFRVK